jgi:CheY-like chemotaxis protein
MIKFRILIVEDESVIALSIKNILEGMSYLVVGILDSGEETVERASEINPDCILMDISLSGEISGIEAAVIIKDTVAVPVVFLTCDSNMYTMKKAEAAEPYGYLLKPVNFYDLDMTISAAIWRHRAEKGKK